MMDEMYAGEEGLDEFREGMDDRLLTGEANEDDIEAEQRIYEFQRTIEKLRTTFREKKQAKKDQE